MNARSGTAAEPWEFGRLFESNPPRPVLRVECLPEVMLDGLTLLHDQMAAQDWQSVVVTLGVMQHEARKLMLDLNCNEAGVVRR